MKALLVCALTVSALAGSVRSGRHLATAAGEPAPQLLRHSYKGTTGEDRDAYVYLPVGYSSDSDRRWPLLLVLHGNGERGDGREDLDWVTVHGPLYEAWVQKRELGFVIVAPQLPLFGLDETVDYIRDRDPALIPRRLERGVPPRPAEFATREPMAPAAAGMELPHGPEGPPRGWPQVEDELLGLLGEVLAGYRVDRARVYLTGLSYGGFGAWHLASTHPERFAAIAPVVGWGHPDLMGPLVEHQVPVWVFAGGRDTTVPEEHFYAGLQELERLGHRRVRFTVHADAGHDAWKRVYAGEDLYRWLLAHRRESSAAGGREVEP